MAGPLDPFTPGVGGMPMVDPNTFAQIRSEWDAFMGDPRGRAALLSTGLAMMQPPSFGDTFTSQLGRAIGAGGESIRATEALDLKQQEADSKDEARQAGSEAKMMNAETRALAAEARSGAAGSKMELQAERLRAAQERGTLSARIRASQLYQNYVKQTSDANRNAKLLGGAEQPILPMNDWIKANPMLKNLGLVDPATSTEDDTEIPSVSPSTTTQPVGAPKPGEVRKGYRFKGGDPSKPESWEKV